MICNLIMMKISPQKMCTSKGHLNHFLAVILGDHGEGVVLRKGTSLYVNGRSDDFIKLKVCAS
jgi:ATP-dependent DNA ligase